MEYYRPPNRLHAGYGEIVNVIIDEGEEEK